MKKSILITIVCLLLTVILVGCTETPMHVAVGKNVDKNLNNLLYTVTKLDTIDNSTLANPDMYSAKNTLNFGFTPAPESTVIKKSIASFNPTDANQVLKELIINKLIDKYKCDSNGNCYLCNKQYGDCTDGTCDNCGGQIICDSNGNCKTCNKQLLLTENGLCKNCNSNCVNGTCSNSTATRFNTNGNTVVLPNTSNNNCASNYRNPLETKNISNITTTDDSDLTSAELKENNDINLNDDLTNSNLSLVKPNLETANNTNIDSGYTSRYDKLGNRNNQSFRNPVRRNESNLEKQNEKLVVEQLSNETSADPSTTQSEPKNVYYYYEESFTPDMLRYKPRFVSGYDQSTTENDFNNYIIKVQKLYAITSDVIEANNELSSYKTNLIDAIQSAKDLNKNFKELQYEPSNYQIQALKNYLADLKTTNNNLRACNGDLNDQLNHISSNNTTLSSSVDIMNSNYIALLNQLDARITFHRNALATLEQLSYIIQDAIVNNVPNISVLPNDDETTIADDNQTTNNQEENIIPSETDDVVNTDLNDNTTIVDDNASNEDKNNSLLDTYKESPLKNVDTYKDINVIENNTINNEIIETNPNNDNANSNNTVENNTALNDDNLNENNTINDNLNNNITNDNVVPNNGINNGINNHMGNGVANNGFNNGINNNLNGNGRVNNRVISQNNLNQDNNVTNGANYYYDANGNLYNANNFNGFEGKSNTNIDTYNYSTLIDTLNRGTVNNGINTLNITPTNSEVVDDNQIEENETIDNNKTITDDLDITDRNEDIESSLNNDVIDTTSAQNENANIENIVVTPIEDKKIEPEDNIKNENGETKISIANNEKEKNMQLESDELVDYTKELQDPEIKFLSDENL